MARGKRQPYNDDERAAAQARLAAALEATSSPATPDGNVKQAAAMAGIPRTTAQEWIATDDEQFKALRRHYKRGFVAEGSELLRKMMAAANDKLDDPEQMRKLPLDKLMIAAGTTYDKIAMAAGENEPSQIAALVAGITIGRAVERGRGQAEDTPRTQAPDADFTVLD